MIDAFSPLFAGVCQEQGGSRRLHIDYVWGSDHRSAGSQWSREDNHYVYAYRLALVPPSSSSPQPRHARCLITLYIPDPVLSPPTGVHQVAPSNTIKLYISVLSWVEFGPCFLEPPPPHTHTHTHLTWDGVVHPVSNSLSCILHQFCSSEIMTL